MRARKGARSSWPLKKGCTRQGSVSMASMRTRFAPRLSSPVAPLPTATSRASQRPASTLLTCPAALACLASPPSSRGESSVSKSASKYCGACNVTGEAGARVMRRGLQGEMPRGSSLPRRRIPATRRMRRRWQLRAGPRLRRGGTSDMRSWWPSARRTATTLRRWPALTRWPTAASSTGGRRTSAKYIKMVRAVALSRPT